MRDPINIIATIGLVLGGALGIAGAEAPQPHPQALLWAIDGAGLVMAAALLTLKYFRAGNDVVAGGFLVFAIGEAYCWPGRPLVLSAACQPSPLVQHYGALHFSS